MACEGTRPAGDPPARSVPAHARRGGPGHPHLRSSAKVIGYHTQATDGDIGHVEDFLVEDSLWAIRYMVVDTRNWGPGKKVLVSPEWIKGVDWSDSKVHVDVTQEQIKKIARLRDATARLLRAAELLERPAR